MSDLFDDTLFIRRRPPAFDVLLGEDPIGVVRRVDTDGPSGKWEAYTVEGARCTYLTGTPDEAARLLHTIHKAVRM